MTSESEFIRNVLIVHHYNYINFLGPWWQFSGTVRNQRLTQDIFAN